MNDRRQVPALPPRGVRRTMFPTAREVLLARLLLRVADEIGSKDEDQEFLDLYNEVKAFAEPVARTGGE